MIKEHGITVLCATQLLRDQTASVSYPNRSMLSAESYLLGSHVTFSDFMREFLENLWRSSECSTLAATLLATLRETGFTSTWYKWEGLHYMTVDSQLIPRKLNFCSNKLLLKQDSLILLSLQFFVNSPYVGCLFNSMLALLSSSPCLVKNVGNFNFVHEQLV